MLSLHHSVQPTFVLTGSLFAGSGSSGLIGSFSCAHTSKTHVCKKLGKNNWEQDIGWFMRACTSRV